MAFSVFTARAAQAARSRGIAECVNAAPARALSAESERCIDLLVVNAIEARDMCQISVQDLASARAIALPECCVSA